MDRFPPLSQAMRLIWIDAQASEDLPLRRVDIVIALRVSVNQASLDLSLFQRLFPGRLVYDRRRRCYLAAPGAAPVFQDWQRRAVTEAVNAIEHAEDEIVLAIGRLVEAA